MILFDYSYRGYNIHVVSVPVLKLADAGIACNLTYNQETRNFRSDPCNNLYLRQWLAVTFKAHEITNMEGSIFIR